MFEAYSVAIKVSLINNVTAGLLGLAGHFKQADGQAKSFQRTLDSIKSKMLIGATMGAAGGGILGFVGKSIGDAKEYANQLSLLNQLGMSQKDVAAGVGAAWKTAFDVPTSGVAANIKTLRELRSAFGPSAYQESEARMIMPEVQRVAGVLTALTGKPQEHVGFDLVKATELRTLGGMTPEAMKRNIDLMSRTLIAMGGTITAQDFHGTFKMGKLATGKWSDEFAYLYLPTLMQELRTGAGGGAQSAGTILMSLYQQMHGKMTKAAMPLWVQAGLVRPGDIVKNSTGQYQVKPGGVAGTPLFENDPYLWVQQYLRPGVERLMKARGITAETAINAMFSNRNAAFGAYTFYAKAQQFERDRKLIEQTKNSEGAYKSLLATNPMLAEQALQQQFKNSMVILGYSVLPDLLKVLQAVLPNMVNFVAWMHEHQKVVKGFMGALLIGGGLLAAGGAINIIAGTVEAFELLFNVMRAGAPILGVVGNILPMAWDAFLAASTGLISVAVDLGWWLAPVAAGLGLVGVAIYFIASRWDTHKSVFENIKTGLSAYGGWLIKFGDDLLKKVRRWEDSPSKHKADTPKILVGFVDGMTSGVVGEIAKWSKLAKGAWNEMVKWWSPVTSKLVSGISDFLAKLDKLGKIAHALMPWAFKDGPKPPAAAVSSTAPMTARDFGAFVGRNAVNSLVGSMLHVPVMPVAPPRKAMVPSGPTGGKQPIHTTVNLDGRPIAKVVSYYQEKDMDFAARSSSGQIDPRRSLTPAGLSFA